MRVMVSLVSSVHGEEMITCLRIVSDRRSSLSQGNGAIRSSWRLSTASIQT